MQIRKVGSLFPLLSRCIHLVCGVGNSCRFEPTCSQYAKQAFETHGVARGSLLVAKRLLRCRPGGGQGLDPVKGNA